MERPRILDLYCGAGGCAVGYDAAGFEVIGVDIAPQRNYPFRFVQADALEILRSKDLSDFDAIHASPPCQFYSWATPLAYKSRHAGSIPDVRAALVATGLPYVIENVEGANREMLGAVRICGSSFGRDLRRHRLFETNWPLVAPPCNHEWQTPRFRSLDNDVPLEDRTLASVIGVHGDLNYEGELELREQAMDIDWMSPAELTQAIPPIYTWFVGVQLAGFIRAGAELSTLPPDRLSKACNKCDVVKQLHRFPKDRRNSDGRGGVCKECKFGPRPHEAEAG